jgi:hypothetical protein
VYGVSPAGSGRPGRRLGHRTPPEERDARGDERDGHDECDPGRQREGRAEGAEEVELADEERGRSGDDDQPRGGDNRGHRGRRLPSRLQTRLALCQAATRRGEEEHRVVRHHPERQGHDERLDLLRDGDVEPFSRAGDHSPRDEEGDARRKECEERRPERAEGEPDDQRDQRDGARLDDRKSVLELFELPVAGRRGPGHPDQRVLGLGGVGRVGVGEVELIRKARAQREMEVRDRGGPALLGGGDEAQGVEDGQREGDLGRAALLPSRADGPLDHALLRGCGEAVWVALDDDGLGGERDGEELRRALARLDGVRLVRDEPTEGEGRAAAEPGQRERAEREEDPGGDEQEPEPDDEPGEARTSCADLSPRLEDRMRESGAVSTFAAPRPRGIREA